MKKNFVLLTILSILLLCACAKEEMENPQTSQQPGVDPAPQQPDMDPVFQQPDVDSESQQTDTAPASQSEQDLWEEIYERYYAPWEEEAMIEEMNQRQTYRESCSFYNEVVQYMELVREVRDTSMIIEPMYMTDLKYYSEDDFKEVPDLILHLAKNEIYARHGYIFQNEDLNNYFMGQLWYTPTCEAKDFDTKVFNDYEWHNLDILAGLDHYGK